MYPLFLAQGQAFKEGYVSEPFENVNLCYFLRHILGIELTPNNGSLQAVQHLLKEHKHDYTVLIVVSVISVLVLLLFELRYFLSHFVSKIIAE